MTIIYRMYERCRSGRLCPLRWQIQSMPIIMTKSLINYLTSKTKHSWHSVDAHFQNRAVSVTLSLFSGWGRAHITLVVDYKGSQCVQRRQWHTNINILWWAVGYLNATINRKPDNQNQRLEPTGLPIPSKTRWSMGTGPGWAHCEAAGRVFGWFWSRTDPFLLS